MPSCSTNHNSSCKSNKTSDTYLTICKFNTNTFDVGTLVYDDDSPDILTNTDKSTACPTYSKACSSDTINDGINTCLGNISGIIKASDYTAFYSEISHIASAKSYSDITTPSGITTNFIVKHDQFDTLGTWANNITVSGASPVPSRSEGDLIDYNAFSDLASKLLKIAGACRDVNHCSCNKVCNCDTVCTCNCNADY